MGLSEEDRRPWTAKDLAGGPREGKFKAMEEVKGLIAYLGGRKPAEGPREQKEWGLMVQHARILLQNLEYWHAAPAYSAATDVRDKHMAENVRWIRDHEEGAKVIAWAANPHVGALRGSGNMGDHLRRMYGDDMFVMSLICNRIVTCGVIHQEIEAGAFKGNELELAAAVRLDGGVGHLWLSIDGRKGANVFAQEEITSNEWRRYRVCADVPKGAKTITYGLAYFGRGAAYLDAVSVKPVRPPR